MSERERVDDQNEDEAEVIGVDNRRLGEKKTHNQTDRRKDRRDDK